jgi:hypothetical protein
MCGNSELGYRSLFGVEHGIVSDVGQRTEKLEQTFSDDGKIAERKYDEY